MAAAPLTCTFIVCARNWNQWRGHPSRSWQYAAPVTRSYPSRARPAPGPKSRETQCRRRHIRPTGDLLMRDPNSTLREEIEEHGATPQQILGRALGARVSLSSGVSMEQNRAVDRL